MLLFLYGKPSISIKPYVFTETSGQLFGARVDVGDGVSVGVGDGVTGGAITTGRYANLSIF